MSYCLICINVNKGKVNDFIHVYDREHRQKLFFPFFSSKIDNEASQTFKVAFLFLARNLFLRAERQKVSNLRFFYKFLKLDAIENVRENREIFSFVNLWMRKFIVYLQGLLDFFVLFWKALMWVNTERKVQLDRICKEFRNFNKSSGYKVF